MQIRWIILNSRFEKEICPRKIAVRATNKIKFRIWVVVFSELDDRERRILFVLFSKVWLVIAIERDN